jgi:hypothetical protein
MNQPTNEFLERLRSAAELRAAGLGWDVVAARVGVKAATCMRWPSQHRDLWRSLMREAERLAEQDGSIEARAMLRMVLRGQDDKNKINAAQQLLKPQKTRPRVKRAIRPEDRALAAFISQVRSVSDEELDRIAREVVQSSNPAGMGSAAGAD